MKNKILSLLLVSLVIISATSCGSLLSKSNQDVMFKGMPNTAIYDGNRKIGEISPNGFTTIPLKKQLGSKSLVARLDGCEDMSFSVGTKFNPPVLWNIVLGGLPGIAIDAATGKLCKYQTKTVDITMNPPFKNAVRSVVDDAPTEEFAERVKREKAGKTTMERTIIRWNIDSEPRGSRIFWRVISSVPDEVKNTNETYLSTTPYEETRSFNILGLTYDNSRDVVIEIKLTKIGYEDQVKRFNVRQALDQQEISTFFELVKK